ncbi:YjbF family lipoprotein [Stenotrophomonas tumulicola]|uniref:YjbF family lipoprotein n=1 Tax=Stenotrophomonas tumulicola TaxID=1685415 RepID=A0A7W3FQY8_9GAMM|nr:YjbF family lipoprotein [Stenotrophomonas tumulicola]
MTGHRVVTGKTLPWTQEARRLLIVALVLLLAGCTSVSRSTSDSFRLLFNRQVEVSPEQVAANRFPQAQIRTPDLSAVMVLGYIDEGQQVWYAADHAVFRLDANGLLVGTTGLGRDLQGRIIGASPFGRLTDVVAPITVQREYDWLPAYAMGVQVQGTVTRAGTDTVEILGRKRELARFEEVLRGGGMKERNIYWADPTTGFIWKSKQYLAPGYAVELVQLKPYRQAKD